PLLTDFNNGSTFFDVTPSFLRAASGGVSQLQKVGNRIHFTAQLEEDLIWGYSDDGGSTWDYQKFEYFPWVHLPFDFYNNDLGLISNGFGTLLRTEDGGNTWNEVSIETNDIRDIGFASEKVAYLVNNELEVYISRDGGLTWTFQSQVTATRGLKTILEVVNETTIYVASDQGFSRSYNEGQTFNTVYNNESVMFDMHFINGTIGYLVGFSTRSNLGATVSVTEDGGVRWRTVHAAGTVVSSFRAVDQLNGEIFTGGFGTTSGVSNLNGTENVTALVSGFSNFCPGEQSNVQMSFTGASPWQVTYRQEDRSNRTFSVTASDTSFAIAVQGDYGPRFVEVLDGMNRQALTSEIAVFKPNDALAVNVDLTSDTICVNDLAKIPITLDGCPPWTIELSDGSEVTTIDDIDTSPFILELNPNTTTTFELLSVQDQINAVQFNEGTQQFDIYVDNINLSNVTESVDQCYLEEPFAVVAYGGLSFPWSYTYEYLGSEYTVEQIATPYDTIWLTESGTYELPIKTISNQCETIDTDLKVAVNIEQLAAPEITEVTRYRYDSIQLSF
ncbi:MAG: YCF48-related protein, partial [Bacteroidota bacterium]